MTTYLRLLQIFPLTPSSSGDKDTSTDYQQIGQKNHYLTTNFLPSQNDSKKIDTEEDAGRKTFSMPKPKPPRKDNELTPEEKKAIESQYTKEKSALYEFKEHMRARGIDVSKFDVSLTNNKIHYSASLATYISEFRNFMMSGSPSLKRGSHSSPSFAHKLKWENLAAKKPKYDNLIQFEPRRKPR